MKSKKNQILKYMKKHFSYIFCISAKKGGGDFFVEYGAYVGGGFG